MSPVDVTASLVYANNTAVGSATAQATWAGDTNHTDSTSNGGLSIGHLGSTVIMKRKTGAPYTYTGLALTPCTAQATGAGMSPVDVTASLVYANNSFEGSGAPRELRACPTRRSADLGNGGFSIGQASSTVTVTCTAGAPYTYT